MKIYIALLSVLLGGACTHDSTIGARYLGARYINNPLGEGIAPDSDPLIRTDAFDCTTFVETALADGDLEKLNKIRYRDGHIGFTNRNHFIETDWLPNNSNLVKNVSAQYGKTAMRTIKINRSEWMNRVHNVSDDTPTKTVQMEYIPYKNLGAIKNSDPLIVLFVLDKSQDFINKTGTDLAVRHMGFLMPGGKVLRHASRRYRAVIDENFNEYVAKRQKSTHNLGVVLLGIKNER